MKEILKNISEEFTILNEARTEIMNKPFKTKKDLDDLNAIEELSIELAEKLNNWAAQKNELSKKEMSIEVPIPEKTLNEKYEDIKSKVEELEYQSKKKQPVFFSEDKKRKKEILSNNGFIETTNADGRTRMIHQSLVGKYFDLVKEQKKLQTELKNNYYQERTKSNKQAVSTHNNQSSSQTLIDFEQQLRNSMITPNNNTRENKKEILPKTIKNNSEVERQINELDERINRLNTEKEYILNSHGRKTTVKYKGNQFRVPSNLKPVYFTNLLSEIDKTIAKKNILLSNLESPLQKQEKQQSHFETNLLESSNENQQKENNNVNNTEKETIPQMISTPINSKILSQDKSSLENLDINNNNDNNNKNKNNNNNNDNNNKNKNNNNKNEFEFISPPFNFEELEITPSISNWQPEEYTGFVEYNEQKNESNNNSIQTSPELEWINLNEEEMEEVISTRKPLKNIKKKLLIGIGIITTTLVLLGINGNLKNKKNFEQNVNQTIKINNELETENPIQILSVSGIPYDEINQAMEEEIQTEKLFEEKSDIELINLEDQKTEYQPIEVLEPTEVYEETIIDVPTDKEVEYQPIEILEPTEVYEETIIDVPTEQIETDEELSSQKNLYKNITDQNILEQSFMDSNLIENMAWDEYSAANQSWEGIQEQNIGYWTDKPLKFEKNEETGSYLIKQQDDYGNWVGMGFTDENTVLQYYQNLINLEQQNTKGARK